MQVYVLVSKKRQEEVITAKEEESVYLQCVAGVILSGLVFKGLAQNKSALIVDLIPVFAVTHVQG